MFDDDSILIGSVFAVVSTFVSWTYSILWSWTKGKTAYSTLTSLFSIWFEEETIYWAAINEEASGSTLGIKVSIIGSYAFATVGIGSSIFLIIDSSAWEAISSSAFVVVIGYSVLVVVMIGSSTL